MPGKIDASLNDKLKSVEWGEYRLGDLFVINTSKSTNRNKIILEKNGLYEFVGRTSVNNGVQGKVNYLGYAPNPSKTLSISQVGESTCLYRPHEWYASQNMFVLHPKYKFTAKILKFFVATINKALYRYKAAYIYPTTKILESLTVDFPIKANKIDINFMEKFMAELESERLKRLSKYLLSNKLDNKLSEQEKNSINAFNSIKWTKYKMSDLFDKVKTKKLFYKAKDLPSEPLDDFVLPCLTSSFNNQGLNYYVPKEGATILRNVITIPQNSDVYRAYYQSSEFTVLSDAYAIKWKYDAKLVSKNQYLFMVMCINKVTDLPIYSYKNKLGGWNVVKEKYILLPQRNGEIDLEYMEVFIAAIKKLAVKSVVEFIDREIKDTQ